MSRVSWITFLLAAGGVSMPVAAAPGPRVPYVAVFEMQNDGSPLRPDAVSRMGNYLFGKLAACGSFRLVPQEKIREKLAKKKTESYQDCYDEECRKELTLEVFADQALSSSIVKAGDLCQVSASLYDLEYAAITNAAEADAPCTEEGIRKAIATVVARLCGGSGGPPADPPGSGVVKPPPEWNDSPGPEVPELPGVAEERGVLRVEGTPRNARVDVAGPRGFGTAGKLATALPYGPATVPAGAYRVQVSAPEHDTDTRTVTVYADRTEVVAVALVPSNGVLELWGAPAGAKVELACAKGFSRTFGLPGSATAIPVPRGSCRVQVGRNGYEPWDRTVEVGGGATVRHEVKLAQIPEGRIGGRDGLTWVRIPGGTFEMGSNEYDGEKPVHRVTVRTFEMTKTEVTFGQYRACVDAGACTAPHVSDGTCYVYTGSTWEKGTLPAAFQGDDQPVVCVDWDQAQAFARWAGGRLPTEAEWEYAARSGGKSWKYPWGNEEATCSRAVMDDGGNGCGRNATWPVCGKTSGNTVQGLCDMAGNVWEWVQDGWHGNYAGAPADGSAWETPAGASRVRRGGSWYSIAGGVRAANRYGYDPGYRRGSLGFRLSRSMAP